jgi:hypothetical protein
MVAVFGELAATWIHDAHNIQVAAPYCAFAHSVSRDIRVVDCKPGADLR